MKRSPLVTLGAAALAASTLAAPLAASAQERPRAEAGVRDTAEARRDSADARTPRDSRQRRAEARRGESVLRAFGVADLAPGRAVIGITLGESGTRGIRVEEVAEDGPAARAGIAAGDHLTAVGDVSLRLDADDLEDPVLRTTAERRLRRALERVEAGDEVTLRVATGDAERAVRLRTVRADALEPSRATTIGPMGRMGLRGFDGDRASIGLSVAGTGTARDTLGAFVLSVVPGSPAERAGIYEGARIASVNGVDLRLDRADVGDGTIAAARAGRLEEELREATAGDEVTLRVYDDGRWRDVRVRTAKASEVYPEGMMRMLPGGMLRMGPGGATIFRWTPGAAGRTWVLPRGDGRRFEVVTPEGRWEGAVPRVRVYRDGGPDVDVQVEVDGLESLEPEVRERVERRLEEARRRLRGTEARWRAVSLNSMTD